MTTPQRFLIRSITIHPDGVALEFMDADTDMRRNGMQLQHVLFVPEGDDYDDEIQALVDAAHALLIDALEDYGNMPALKLADMVPDETEDEDEDEDPLTGQDGSS